MISRCKTILLTMFLLTSPYLLTAYGVKEGKKNIESRSDCSVNICIIRQGWIFLIRV